MVQSNRVYVVNFRGIVWQNFESRSIYQTGRLAQLVVRVLSMHDIAGTITAFSSNNMVALISQLGERQTEEKIISHLKAPFLSHGQHNFTNFNSSTEQIQFFSLITNLHPTINLSIKSSLDCVHNLKPN